MQAPYCALCGGNMHHLGLGNSLPPFWSQMPRFFAYPFKLNGGVFLALIAVLTSASAKLLDPRSLLIWLPIFIVVSLVIRQGLRVIEFCSQGRSRPPGIAELFDGNPATLKMFGLMLAYGMMVGSLRHFGFFGIGAIICFSGLLPASIMLLAVDGTLRDALDPSRVFELVARTGWSYLGLILALIVTAQGPQEAIGLLPAATIEHLAQDSPHVLLAMLVVSTAYFNMVMGAMMGHLLFQHHHDLGIRPDEAYATVSVDNRTLELARAVILVRESRYEDALRQMAGMVSDYPNDIKVLEYHHQLLCEAASDPDRVMHHTERYLQALLDMRRTGRLITALQAAHRVIPHYKPKSIAIRRALAEEYFRQRQFKPAIALLDRLHQEVPASDELPAAYYLLARIYSDGMRDDGKAVMMLDFLLKHFPGHAMTGEIETYRKVILSLGQTSQAAV
jgi:tetratricopeptide (TPR) repeat protein